MIQTFLKSMPYWLVKKNISFLVLSIILAVLGASQLSKLGITGDFKVLFNDRDPNLQLVEMIEDEFLQSDNLIIILSPEDQDVFSQESLEMVEDLTNLAWMTPYSIRVDSLTNYQKTVSENDDLLVNPLVEDARALDREKLQAVRDYASEDTFLQSSLISSNNHVTALAITLALPEDRMNAIEEVADYARAMKTDIEFRFPGTEVHLSGIALLERTFAEIIGSDLQNLLPAILLVCFLVLGTLLRSLSAVTTTMIIIGLSVGFSMGIAGLFGVVLTPTSVMAPLMIMVLAMADSIHLLTHYIIHLRKGMNKHEAMQKSIELNMGPIFLTSITTAIGFLGMNFSASPAFHDFGNITAGGVMIAFVLSHTALPAIALWLPTSAKHEPLAITPFMLWLSRLAVNHNRSLFWSFLVVIIALVMFIPRNQLNDDIIKYFDESLEFRQAAEFANANLTGFQNIMYKFDADEAGGINNPEFLQKVDEFAQWYRMQPNVTNVFSYVDIIKGLNRTMNNNSDEAYAIPENQELAAQYQLLYELSLPAGFDLTKDINNNRSALKLTVSLKKMDNDAIIALEERAQEWLAANTPSIQSPGGSQALMFAHLGEQVTLSMVHGSLFALILITLVLMIGLGSIKYGLLSLIPNLFPALIIYGIWGLFIQEVNLAAAMTFSISLGLVVDDTVHFLSKYLSAKKKGYSVEQSVEYSFVTAGSALVVTTFSLAAGIFILTFSHFGPSVTSAMMICPIIVVALLLDLFFLPSVLCLAEKKLLQTNKDLAPAS